MTHSNTKDIAISVTTKPNEPPGLDFELDDNDNETLWTSAAHYVSDEDETHDNDKEHNIQASGTDHDDGTVHQCEGSPRPEPNIDMDYSSFPFSPTQEATCAALMDPSLILQPPHKTGRGYQKFPLL